LQRNYIFILLSCLFAQYVVGQNRKFHFVETKMGSPFNLILVSDDSIKAGRLAKESFQLIDSFSHIYSDYDSSSELSKISMNAGKGFQKCSPALWEILVFSRTAYQNSLHSFDISVGPLSSLWRTKRKRFLFPDSTTILNTKNLVGLNQIAWRDSLQEISLPKPGMKLDLGGIAKGFIAQK